MLKILIYSLTIQVIILHSSNCFGLHKAKVVIDESPLHHAVRISNKKKVQSLAATDDKSKQNSLGETPVMVAISNIKNGDKVETNYRIIKLLIEHDADVNKGNYAGKRPLHCAIKRGDKRLIKLLLSAATLNAAQKDKSYCTPLILAITHYEDQEEYHDDNDDASDDSQALDTASLIQSLLDKGAEVNTAGPKGLTPLHHAAAKTCDDPAVLNTLLKVPNIDPWAKDNAGVTPLMLACSYCGTKSYSLLQAPGARAGVNLTDREGYTALHGAIEADDQDIVAYLLSAQAHPDIGPHGKTPFDLALKGKKHKQVVRLLNKLLLLHSGDVNKENEFRVKLEAAYNHNNDAAIGNEESDDTANINAPSNDDSNNYPDDDVTSSDESMDAARPYKELLFIASKDGHAEVARFLCKLDPQLLKAFDNNRETPLYKAAASGEVEVVRVLLDAINNFYETEVLNYFLESATIYEWTPLCAAASDNKTEVVKLLLQAGADRSPCSRTLARHRPNADIQKLFMTCALRADDGNEVVKILSSLLCSGNGDEFENDATLLFLATKAEERGVIDFLCRHSSAFTAVNSEGKTPLYIASDAGRVDIVTKLLEGKGRESINLATPDDISSAPIEKERGWTPLCVAAYWNHKTVVCLLLRNGADPNHRNHAGHTALSLAKYKNHQNIIPLLEEASKKNNREDVVRSHD